MKFNPPFGMKIPVERVNNHYEVRGSNPELRKLEVSLQRFDIYPDYELGLVAQRKSKTLAREEASWSG